ncbi:hypothetical protein J2R96_006246 [Bradyrhizobium elkanii]|nr:hypothetical protein [Bradyrhizobium elkanii]
MFEVFTARIANQHIVLQAIGAGLFSFQRMRRRETIHGVIRNPAAFSAERSGAYHRLRRLRFAWR